MSMTKENKARRKYKTEQHKIYCTALSKHYEVLTSIERKAVRRERGVVKKEKDKLEKIDI